LIKCGEKEASPGKEKVSRPKKLREKGAGAFASEKIISKTQSEDAQAQHCGCTNDVNVDMNKKIGEDRGEGDIQ